MLRWESCSPLWYKDLATVVTYRRSQFFPHERARCIGELRGRQRNNEKKESREKKCESEQREHKNIYLFFQLEINT